MYAEQIYPRTAPTPHLTRVKVPATCGELMQGWIEGRDFLVNCPIDLFSYATTSPSDEVGLHVEDSDRFEKIERALSLLSLRVEASAGRQVVVRSHIPRGKGMASSTADLTAALLAASRSLGVDLSPLEVSRLLIQIEPSDCTHLPGIAHVNHLKASIRGTAGHHQRTRCCRCQLRPQRDGSRCAAPNQRRTGRASDGSHRQLVRQGRPRPRQPSCDLGRRRCLLISSKTVRSRLAQSLLWGGARRVGRRR